MPDGYDQLVDFWEKKKARAEKRRLAQQARRAEKPRPDRKLTADDVRGMIEERLDG